MVLTRIVPSKSFLKKQNELNLLAEKSVAISKIKIKFDLFFYPI
jgi:hypothetical protein